MQIFASFRLF